MRNEQQSPINLKDPVYADFGPNYLKIGWAKSGKPTHGHLKKDEHGVQIEFGFDIRHFVELGGKKFHLAGFHFHHPSEHLERDKQQTVELHIVHQNKDDGTRVVLAIFIDPSSESGEPPELMTELHSLLLKHVGEQAPIGVSTNPAEFLPENLAEFHRYERSLTTPPFDENVRWVVFRDHLSMRKSLLVDLIKLFLHPARMPQPLNRRFLLANFRP